MSLRDAPVQAGWTRGGWTRGGWTRGGWTEGAWLWVLSSAGWSVACRELSPVLLCQGCDLQGFWSRPLLAGA